MFKILVVEDDKDLNKTVCSFLNHSGYEAVGCLNAVAAYDTLAESMFDLIISDIMMPDIDGFEFASNVRELNEDIPILFMTARDDITSKQRGFRIGIDDYMVKPIDLDELESFNKMAEELSGVETLRTDFIANVSHEMNTPLAVLQNYGTLLQDPFLSEEKRKEYAKGVAEWLR